MRTFRGPTTSEREFVLTVGGVLVTALGVAAVFLEKDGTVSSALLASGFATLVVVHLGPRLTSVKVGNAELVLAAAQTARQADEAGDAEAAGEIWKSIATLIERTSAVGTALNSEEVAERDVESTLAALAPKGTSIERDVPLALNRRGRPWRPDITLTNGPRKLVVEVLHGASSGAVQRKVEVFDRVRGVELQGGEAVTYAFLADERSQAELASVGGDHQFEVISWGVSKDIEGLKSVLGAALEGATPV